jgi:RNA polymerase sigma-70 factor (ECF subfamily)
VGGTNDQRSDRQLIDAAKAGDLSAFEALYERYRDWVWRVALRVGGDRELALDVVQETFIHLLDRLPRFVLRAQLKSYLYPVARNLTITHLRRRREKVVADPPEGADVSSNPGESGAVSAALGALSLEQREVLILRFADDLSLQEIATALEIPLGTVKSRLHHALASLRANPALKNHFES